MKLNATLLQQALELLAGNMDLANTPEIRPVVCGGASLIATEVVSRTTKDVDVVAFRGADGTLVAPVPLPDFLLQAAKVVARDLGLEPNWLNNGPSRDEGGLFQMGLPAGFSDRLTEKVYGPRLTVYFIGRRDQIFFKIFSAADRGGVDLDDLAALRPTVEELEAAARWAMSIDVSEGYRMLLRELLKNMDYESVAARI
jgi:hypothetical protein